MKCSCDSHAQRKVCGKCSECKKCGNIVPDAELKENEKYATYGRICDDCTDKVDRQQDAHRQRL